MLRALTIIIIILINSQRHIESFTENLIYDRRRKRSRRKLKTCRIYYKYDEIFNVVRFAFL